MIAWKGPIRLRLQHGISVLGLSLLMCGCTNSLQRVPIQYSPVLQQTGEESAKVASPQPVKEESPQPVKVETPQPKVERSEFQGKGDGVVKPAPLPSQLEAKNVPEPTKPGDSEGVFTGWYRSAKGKVADLFGGGTSAAGTREDGVRSSSQSVPQADVTKGDGEAVHKPMSDETTLGEQVMAGGLMSGEKNSPDAAVVSSPDSLVAKGAAERIDHSVDIGDGTTNPLEAAPWQTGSSSVSVGKGYYVSMGQFSEYVESEKMVKRMKVLNVPYLQQQSRTDGVPSYRVYAGPFGDFDEAQAMVKDLAKHDMKAGPITNRLE